MQLAQAYEAMKQYDKRLATKTPYGRGVVLRRKKDSEDEWELHVLVDEVRRSHRWLERLTLNGMPVKVEASKINALALLDRRDNWRPAPCGISIGHYNIGFGTAGAIVYKAGSKYILSNNHVLADENDASIGDNIYQPGPGDGGNIGDKIGELDDYVTLVFNDAGNPNSVDAAICVPDDENDLLEYAYELGSYNGTSTVSPGDRVIKSGRTTGVSETEVTGITGLLAISYSGGKTGWFTGQIEASVLVDSGDSGSLLIKSETGEAVGLIFAGSDTYSYANPIADVASELGVTFYNSGPRGSMEAEYDITDSGATLRDVLLNPSPLSWVGFLSSAIDSAANRLYYGITAIGAEVFHVYNISNPSSLTPIGSVNYPTDAIPEGITVIDNDYVATFAGDLYIVDVNTPASPSFSSAYTTAGYSKVGVLKGNYMYVQGHNALSVWYVSDPTSPTEEWVSSDHGVSMYSMQTLTYNGNYLYCLSWLASNSILSIFDITTPDSPSLLSQISLAGIQYASSVAVYGNYAYFAAPYQEALYMYNVTNPLAPSAAGSIDLPEAAVVVKTSAYGSGLLFVGTSFRKPFLLVYTLLSPTSPSFATSYPFFSDPYLQGLESDVLYIDFDTGTRVLYALQRYTQICAIDIS